MDNCRWWVGACGVGLLYPFFDGGGCLLCSQRGVGHMWVVVVIENKDICKGLFVNVALLDPSRKPWVTPHPCRTLINSTNGLISKMGVLSGPHLAVSVPVVPGLPPEF